MRETFSFYFRMIDHQNRPVCSWYVPSITHFWKTLLVNKHKPCFMFAPLAEMCVINAVSSLCISDSRGYCISLPQLPIVTSVTNFINDSSAQKSRELLSLVIIPTIHKFAHSCFPVATCANLWLFFTKEHTVFNRARKMRSWVVYETGPRETINKLSQ